MFAAQLDDLQRAPLVVTRASAALDEAAACVEPQRLAVGGVDLDLQRALQGCRVLHQLSADPAPVGRRGDEQAADEGIEQADEASGVSPSSASQVSEASR